MTRAGIRAATAMATVAALESKGIPYCVLRNHAEIPTEPGRDIDLVVNEADLEMAEEVLVDTAEEFGWPQILRCRGHHEGTSYYLLDRESDPVGQLEFHFTRVRWAGLPVLTESDLLDKRVRSSHGLCIASDHHVAVQRLVQTGLSGGLASMKREYRASIEAIARDDPGGFVEALSLVGIRRATCVRVVRLLATGSLATAQQVILRYRTRFVISRLAREPSAFVDAATVVARKARPDRRPACGVAVISDSPALLNSVRTLFLTEWTWDGSRSLLREAHRRIATVGMVVIESRPHVRSEMLSRITVDVRGLDPAAARNAIVDRFVANHELLGRG